MEFLNLTSTFTLQILADSSQSLDGFFGQQYSAGYSQPVGSEGFTFQSALLAENDDIFLALLSLKLQPEQQQQCFENDCAGPEWARDKKPFRGILKTELPST